MKIIVINGAPRMESGNTQTVLTPFMVGLKDGGADLDVVTLGRLDIRHCQGCFYCYAQTPGRCAQADDMEELAEGISAADMMVLATPVYLDGMTALSKIFLDRLVVFLDPHFIQDETGLIHPLRRKFPEKMFLVSVCGYPGLHNFDPLTVHMRRVGRNLHSEFVGALLRPAVFSLLLAKKYPDKVRSVMDAMRTAGEELARDGKPHDGTLADAAAEICSQEELMNTANSFWDRELAKYKPEPA